MNTIFLLILSIILLISISPAPTNVHFSTVPNDDEGAYPTVSKKTKPIEVSSRFLKCLKNTTSVPSSIITQVSSKSTIYTTEAYEYVTSGYSTMIQNQINARFKFCALSIYGTGNEPAETKAFQNDCYCKDPLAVTECFIQFLPSQANQFQEAYENQFPIDNKKSRTITIVSEKKPWSDLIMTYIYTDNMNFVNCLEVNVCTTYFEIDY